MRVRAGGPDDVAAVAAFLDLRSNARVARLGELMRPLDHPALLACDGDRLVGLLTYVIDDGAAEILTLHALERYGGVGTALVEELRRVATDAGCTRLWVITSNDNVDALRFYQRRGFRLCAVRPGAIDEWRATLKPEIPAVGDHGIPIRDELELEQPL